MTKNTRQILFKYYIAAALGCRLEAELECELGC
jgi:hypothetical protein